jgi:hypothetical protein
MSLVEVSEITTKNANQLFKLGGPKVWKLKK